MQEDHDQKYDGLFNFFVENELALQDLNYCLYLAFDCSHSGTGIGSRLLTFSKLNCQDGNLSSGH